jgi:hypothetical protein
VRVKKYTDSIAKMCPELVGFNPMYGSSELSESDTIIKFWFNNQAVFPSRQSNTGGPGGGPTLGRIVIYRGGLKPDGKIIRTTE